MTKIGDIAQIKAGYSPSFFKEGECLYIKVNDLNSSVWIQKDSESKVGRNQRAALVNAGAIIFPKRGGAILTNKIRIMGVEGYIDTNMMALEVKETIDNKFLYLLLESAGLYKIADTSTIPQINNKHISPFEILMPRQDEQVAIAKMLICYNQVFQKTFEKLSKVQQIKYSLFQKMFA